MMPRTPIWHSTDGLSVISVPSVISVAIPWSQKRAIRQIQDSSRGGEILGEAVADGDESIFARQECGDDVGIEVCAGIGDDHRFGHVVREGGFIHPLRSESVIHIGERDDPAAQGNCVAGQVVGIAAAVEPLVMGGGDIAAHLQKLHAGELP